MLITHIYNLLCLSITILVCTSDLSLKLNQKIFINIIEYDKITIRIGKLRNNLGVAIIDIHILLVFF